MALTTKLIATSESLAELASLFEPGEFCAVVADLMSADERWRNAAHVELTQWVCPTPIAAAETESEFVELADEHRDEVHALAKATDPGPFELQTRVLGNYISIDQGGHLMAMAGERPCFDGHREVSAACTDPAYVGHGHAQALVRVIGRHQQARGREPLLPVIFLAAAPPLPFHAGALLLWTVLFPDYRRWAHSA